MKKFNIIIQVATDKGGEEQITEGVTNDLVTNLLSGTELELKKVTIEPAYPFYVAAYGSDCDGHNNGSIMAYDTLEAANKSAAESNGWSDGLQYSVIDRKRAIQYCNSFEKNIDHVDDCVFDINNDLTK